MKRLLLPGLALLLAGCGGVNVAPSAGQLLDAPTTLNMTGLPLTAQATPVVTGETFRVKVKLRVPRDEVPKMTVINLYVVTRDGVWSAGPGRTAQRRCANTCTLAVASGPARGLRSGTGAQVVVGLQDTQGRTYLLRDDTVRVK
ncbi:hypothetical protein SAMN04488058_10192 [Deinococcus reticulitermitis]|uniref:Lipoprotein n=1 Tax=Deinococcus reticulitermitis TaxID=856736 RepID=A0A1H6S566_9DEIO|nr:hypothetical protein [Deinococcus reticulitermitis]SEI59927.1 hypothetical protein SAMN04488058_10192 [Deinococcus reticulitermitis]